MPELLSRRRRHVWVQEGQRVRRGEPLSMRLCLWTLALGVALAATPARADDVRPVQVHIVEREPGNFLVQWLVPQLLPIRAMPSPVLPAAPTCPRT